LSKVRYRSPGLNTEAPKWWVKPTVWIFAKTLIPGQQFVVASFCGKSAISRPSREPTIPSENFFANSLAAMYFRKSAAIRNLLDHMSILLASIDPVQWKWYRDAYAAMSHKLLLLPECNFDFEKRKGHIHCFVGVHLVINCLVMTDGEDRPDARWVGMLVFGDFRDGNIWFPDLEVALPFQVGDVVAGAEASPPSLCGEGTVRPCLFDKPIYI
jgi:hypothetical protein